MKPRAVFLSTLLFSLILILVGCTTNTAPSAPTAGQPSAAAPSAGQSASSTGTDPLPSWNDGPAKQAILNFVKTTTDKASPQYVQPQDRIATFDQDGTTWVEQPMYSQVLFMYDRVADLAPQHPEWSNKPLFKGLIAGDIHALDNATDKDIQSVLNATDISMPVDEFASLVKRWM